RQSVRLRCRDRGQSKHVRKIQFFGSSSSGISDWLWELVDFGRAGKRGLQQKCEFIQVGLREGFLSNQYPFVVDESYLNNHKSAKVRTSTLVRYEDENFSSEQVSRSRGAPKAKVAPSSSSSRVVRENLETENPYVNSSAASASRPAGEFSFEGVTFTVFEAAGVSGGSSSSSGAVAVPEPKAAPLRRELQLTYRPCYPSQHCYRPFTDRVERIEQVDLVGIRDKSIVKVLFLDWHQVVDRGRDGKTDTLGKVLEEVQNYSPAVSVIHVKLPRKPSFGGRAPAVSFFAESEQLIEDWLLRMPFQSEALSHLAPLQGCGKGLPYLVEEGMQVCKDFFSEGPVLKPQKAIMRRYMMDQR
ncbi:unnamed protein product, partial [Cladocopium goreaui]